MNLSVPVRNYRRGLLAAAAFVLCAASACDTTTKVILLANFSFAFPATVTVEASPDPAYKWRAKYTVAITEINGVGAKIDSINLAVSQAAGGVDVAGITDELFKFSTVRSSERIEPMATVSVEFTVDYVLPSGDRESLIDMIIVFIDDGPVRITRTLELRAI